MMFVEAVCETAKEDLTDFFDFWGFFTPVDDLKLSSTVHSPTRLQKV